jgi:hypothetical protein
LRGDPGCCGSGKLGFLLRESLPSGDFCQTEYDP